MEYEDFIIQIGSDLGEGNLLQVLKSPAGEGRGHLKLSTDAALLSSTLSLGGNKARSAGVTSPDRDLRVSLPEPLERLKAQQLGDHLFRGLFSGQILSLFDRSLGTLGNQPSKGLRIKLKLDAREGELARLASLPWEFLWRRETQDFLSLSRLSPVVRYLDVPRAVSPISLGSKLRILVVASSPAGLAPLDLKDEMNSLKKACRSWRGIAVSFLEQASAAEVRRVMLEEDFHVLHFMGHGGFDTSSGEGVLYLTASNGGPEPVTGLSLATMLKDFKSLGMVLLNACETAKLAESDTNPFAGVAGALVLGGLPAVVAMQFPISDRAALAFSAAFYRRLAAGDPVDAAVVEGRHAILGIDGGTLEWATPVLFLRVPDAGVFKARPRFRPKSILAVLLVTALSALGYPLLDWLTRAPPSALEVAGGRFLKINQRFQSSINGLSGTLRSIEILPAGRMRLHFRFNNASAQPVGLGFDYRSTYLADERGNRYDVLATDTDKETTVDKIAPGAAIDRWMEFPAPLDQARRLSVGLTGREALSFPFFSALLPSYPSRLSRTSPAPKPLPGAAELALQRSVETNIRGLSSQFGRIVMLPGGRMRWHFSMINGSDRDLPVGFDYSRIYLQDDRGNRYAVLGSDTGGGPGQVYQEALRRALRVNHWFEFSAPFDSARNFTVVLASHDRKSLKFVPFHFQIPYYPPRYSIPSAPKAKLLKPMEPPEPVSKTEASPPRVEEPSPPPEVKAPPAEPVRSLVTDKGTGFATSVNGLVGRLGAVEKLDDGRLRWNFDLLNQSTGSVEVGFNIDQTYLADNNGTRYRALRMSTLSREAIPAGGSHSYWIEFPQPTSGARRFIVVLVSQVPDSLRVPPFQIELPGK